MTMAKGYWIGHVTVTDPDSYAKYIEANGPIFAKWGARFIVRGGQHQALEGPARDRHVVLEFDSYQDALDCYRSPEYQEVFKLRKDAGIADIMIVEGT